MFNKNLSKLIAALVIILGFNDLSFAITPANFSDVGNSNPNQSAIEYVKNQGIVQGYSDGTYRPDRTINRAEFTKIVIEAQFASEVEACQSADFSDTEKGKWFTPYICVAQKRGIINGYSDGTFRPSQNISFVEAAKIIVNTFGLSAGSDNEVWYRPFVNRLELEKAIPTSVGSFSKNITRGEMAEMIYRLKTGIKNKETKTYNGLAGLPEVARETDEFIPKAPSNETQPADGVAAPTEDLDAKLNLFSPEGNLLAGETSPFIEFNQADYDKAKKEGRNIMLYFYASWCPLCANETSNSTEPAFDSLTDSRLVGFRVNFNDGDTDDFEKGLAREFKVTSQHTKVFIVDGEVTEKTSAIWKKDRYLEEFDKLK